MQNFKTIGQVGIIRKQSKRPEGSNTHNVVNFVIIPFI